MNKKRWIFFLIISGGLFLFSGFEALVIAQEETYDISHKNIFGSLQRPSVSFPHEQHVEALEKLGCEACHHIFDQKTRTLVPADGEETTCSDCHGLKKVDNTPGLREAYHGSCTVCHRKLNRSGKKSGPVTCGECHKK